MFSVIKNKQNNDVKKFIFGLFATISILAKYFWQAVV